MNELALFAGAGGGLLATQHLLGFRTVCYVEIAPYPVAVLEARIRDGLLDDAPIWDDVRTFDGKPWRGVVDLISAGFPCQPYSSAGKQRADADERNLWPDTIRVVREVRPRYVLLENVSRLLVYPYARRIFADLAESGYDCRWDCLPAAAVGAPHIRDRLFIVAYTGRLQSGKPISEFGQSVPAITPGDGGDGRLAEVLAYTTESGLEGSVQPEVLPAQCSTGKMAYADGGGFAGAKDQPQGQGVVFGRSYPIGSDLGGSSWWEVEPRLDRVADGVAHRVDRIAAIGEGQVPLVVATAWRILSEHIGSAGDE